MTLRRSPLRRRKPERMGVRVRPQIRSEGFKQFTRGYRCLIEGKAGHVCGGKIQFCHVRKGNDGGMGVKPSDCHGVPICAMGHVPDQHQHGEAAFERAYGVDLNAEADGIWNAWLKTDAG